jgi:hypothetical protein
MGSLTSSPKVRKRIYPFKWQLSPFSWQVFINKLSLVFLTRLERLPSLQDVVAAVKAGGGNQLKKTTSDGVYTNQAAWKMVATILDRIFFGASLLAVCVALAVVFPR